MAKSIVILSDGTGNAASSIWRTNVWRTFQSIDLTGSDQVARYDDGVGTSSFKPLAILGGAFGWGLKRNVLDLYKFLCRNYTPGADIYGFGFSRGAFTIRVVVGLVAAEGLIPYTTEDDLAAKAIAAYRAYRSQHFGRGLGTVLRPPRDMCVAIVNRIMRREPYVRSANITPGHIRFLGLWDTVAAYGLPVDEWTRGIHKYIWPLELPNRKIWPGVERACHALALDDERTTFHPILWDEQTLPAGKVSQVWFAGMHSNVGGGYPDDSLAGVPLLWILKEAEKCGLRFKHSPALEPDAIIAAKSALDKDGRLYNSRAGLASYYRYGPRDVEALCNDRRNGVVAAPVIHETVFGRMQSKATAYAPLGLPSRYFIAKNDGTVIPQDSPGSEFTTRRANDRAALQPLAWDVVWRRRASYLLTVAASLNLVVFPLLHNTHPQAEYTTKLRFVSETVRVVGVFLPDFVTTWWLDSYATNPRKLLFSITVLFACILLGALQETDINDRMLAAWRGTEIPRNAFKKIIDNLTFALRTAPWYQGTISLLKYQIAPALFAFLTLAGAVALLFHVAFYFEDAAGMTCKPTGGTDFLQSGQKSKDLLFPADQLCWPTGVKLKRGERYIISITNPVDWKQGDYETHLGGYEIGSLPTLYQRAEMFVLIPLRRVLLRPWNRIVARVGETGTDEYFLDPDSRAPTDRLEEPIIPHRSGELYLYVNGPVLPYPLPMDWLYKRWSHGTAKVSVMQKDKQ